MYRIITKTIQYDRDRLCSILSYLQDKDNADDLIESFLEDCELRPEAKMILTTASIVDDLNIATMLYNRQLDEFDFNKDPFKAVTRSFYVSYVELIEVDYDHEALRVFDIISKCNELTGGTV